MFSVSFHSVHFSHSASVRYYDKVEEKEDFWQTGRCFNESRFSPLFSLKTISSSIPSLKFLLLFYMLWPLQTMWAIDLEYNLKRKKCFLLVLRKLQCPRWTTPTSKRRRPSPTGLSACTSPARTSRRSEPTTEREDDWK